MKNRQKNILLFLLLPLFSFSQVNITGSVKDEYSPIAYANIVLQDTEGHPITGAITDENGDFKIQATEGEYRLIISYLGYENNERDILLEKDIAVGTIVLKEDTGQLEEVIITAKKPLIVQKADRLVYNVENSVSAIGGDAMHVLGTAPGLMVINNTITMLGKGTPRVMIDGRMLELTGDELVGFLGSLSADDIKNVEIIATPPAKYEAEGSGGLVNINLRKAALNSWKNTITTAYDQNTYSIFSIRNNFFYNKDKLQFSAGVGGKVGDVRRIEQIDTEYPNGPWELDIVSKNSRNNLSGRFSIDYDLTDNITIGGQYMGVYNYGEIQLDAKTDIFNTEHQLESILINPIVIDRDKKSHSANAHLIATLDTIGRKLSFDVDYFTFDSDMETDLFAESFTPEMEFIEVDMAAKNTTDVTINNVSFKTDMEHPLDFINLSYGGKLSFINTQADAKFFNTITGNPILDPDQSNEFEYQENNQAVYVNGSKSFNDKWSLQLGLRYEATQTEGYSKTTGETNKKEYAKLFSSFYLMYKKSDDHSFSFNYGKRVNRPPFWMLNPYRIYTSSNTYAEGNPFLQPSFSDNFEFTYMYNSKLRTNVFLNILNDGYGTIFTSDPEENIQTITRENYYKQYQYGISESYTADITSWWQSRNAINLTNRETKIYDVIDATPLNGMQIYFSSNNTISLFTSTKLQLDYWYSSPFKTGLFEIGKPQSSFNVGIKQSILGDNLQLVLLFNDVFNRSQLREYNSAVNGIKQSYYEDNSNRFFRFSLTYTFGNDDTSVKQRDFGNTEEQQRAN
ncbi:outer membrane beta-barrel family protein [Galbibacter sp. EGI 63066]|uniref:TonB-dependent receptor domain-containing protein n=1 Tax=Galbibacter sp. EGI 63066 TaxID=2993559 RepID=UPI002248A8D1|nr:outer membrane beta-barrel family protein [Galbibacter sp. EGI 63066]MCX2679739.1 outer membrane beta-barrel family protein [Galbibacter sp. EGI 63066]